MNGGILPANIPQESNRVPLPESSLPVPLSPFSDTAENGPGKSQNYFLPLLTRIVNFRFWIGGIAWLYPLIKQAEFLKSKIRNPNSKI
jgi:hypothetical protein